MKLKYNWLCLALLVLIPGLARAQNNGLSVITYKLSNGLTVMLNPDPNATTVFGAVAVKAGSKYDPANATGLAHYLEHMCFKGTRTMGTVNYKAEKPHLDTIVMLYDTLARTTDKAARAKLQKHINEVSIRAAQYAIPNDMDRLIHSFGGDNVNAFTSFEEIVYHNSFPAAEMEKWLDIYAERFKDPVFRLFQSELEVVYEEKNRLSDNFASEIMFRFLANMFKHHPYGTQTTIGRTEDLKNPPLRQMMEYYDTYFVANNMALVITGNFDVKQTQQWIAEKFSAWKSGNVPAFPDYPKTTFKGQEVVSMRITPVKLGILGYNAPRQNEPGTYTMQVINQILNNNNETGLLDKLRVNSKLLSANFIYLPLQDAGVAGVVYLPKIVGQSLENATALVRITLDSLKVRRMDDARLNAAKNNLILAYYKQMEEPQSRAMFMVNAFIYGESWDSVLSYPAKINAITAEDIQHTARMVFTDSFLNLQSRTGLPKKDKIEKPGFQAPAINTNVESEYAKKLHAIPSDKSIVHFADMKKDVSIVTYGSGHKAFVTLNPVNNVFQLNVNYEVSKADIPNIDYAAAYASYLAPGDMLFQDFKEKLNKLGLELSIEFTQEKGLDISLSGLESQLDTGLYLLNDLMLRLSDNKEALKRMIQDDKASRKLEFADPSSRSTVLAKFVRYGENSEYLDRLSTKELKKLDGSELVRDFQKSFVYPHTVTFTGKTKPEELAAKLSRVGFITTKPDNSPQNKSKKAQPLAYPVPTAYVYYDNKSRQSHITYYRNLGEFNKEKLALINVFNSYFGGDMSGIVFQEIRESRSLAYASRYIITEVPQYGNHTLVSGYIGCQADKTPTTIMVMDSIIAHIPLKEDRFAALKEGNLALARNSKPAWRDLPESVRNWQRLGYTMQPEQDMMPQLEKMSFEGMIGGAQALLHQAPQVIAIVGPKNHVPIAELKKHYKVIVVTDKDIRRK